MERETAVLTITLHCNFNVPFSLLCYYKISILQEDEAGVTQNRLTIVRFD